MIESIKAIGVECTKDGDISVTYSTGKKVIAKTDSIINCLKNYQRQKEESQAKSMDNADKFLKDAE